MTTGKKRKVLAPEFKAKIGLEALRGERTINEIGLAYGVHPGQVSQFKREIEEQASSLFAGKRGPKPVSAHTGQEALYAQIGQLKVELDWLKKSPGSAYYEAIILDRAQGRYLHQAPMRFGKRVSCDRLCQAQTQAGAGARCNADAIDRPRVHAPPLLRQP